MAVVDISYSRKHTPTIVEFAKDRSFIRALMGPFGSGKSVGCLMEIIQCTSEEDPGPDGIKRSRWGVVRNTYPELQDTTIRTVHQWLKPEYFGKYNSSTHDYLIKNIPGMEIELMFRSLDRPDHVKKLFSMELTGAWLNEVREIPWSIVEVIQGRVGRYPAKKDGGCKWFGVLMDTNSPDTDSKFYEFFEEIKPSNARLFKQPSGLSPQAENLPNLPVNYYSNLKEGKSDQFIKVYIEGMYGYVQDGKPVYPEYVDSLHCKEFEPNPQVAVTMGFDFGLTPACVLTQLLPSGQFTVFDEIIGEHIGIEKFADHLAPYLLDRWPNLKFNVSKGDPAGKSESQTDEKTCFQILETKGFQIEAGKQDPTLRLESVRKPLTSLIGGRPGFLLHPRCKMLRKGFQGAYKYKRIQVAEERYGDTPVKNEYSHPQDALQYVATSIFGDRITQKIRAPQRIPVTQARSYAVK